MKSVEVLLAETTTVLKEAGKTAIAEMILNNPGSIEQRLAEATKVCKEFKIKLPGDRALTEARPAIKRKNFGSAVNFQESASASALPAREERIAECARDFGFSQREASIYLGFGDPGNDVKESDSVITERAARWKKYCCVLKEAECMSLAKRGLEPR